MLSFLKIIYVYFLIVLLFSLLGLTWYWLVKFLRFITGYNNLKKQEISIGGYPKKWDYSKKFNRLHFIIYALSGIWVIFYIFYFNILEPEILIKIGLLDSVTYWKYLRAMGLNGFEEFIMMLMFIPLTWIGFAATLHLLDKLDKDT